MRATPPDSNNIRTNASVSNRFHEAVVSALIAGSAEKLERIFLGALHEHGNNAALLALNVAQICLTMGRKRAARNWIERLSTLPVALKPDELATAIGISTQIGYAEIVLLFASKLSAEEPSVVAQYRLDASAQILALAKRLRLPRGRSGAWTQHVKLLSGLCDLLEPALPHFDEARRERGNALFDCARRLLAKGSHKDVRKQPCRPNVLPK